MCKLYILDKSLFSSNIHYSFFHPNYLTVVAYIGGLCSSKLQIISGVSRSFSLFLPWFTHNMFAENTEKIDGCLPE